MPLASVSLQSRREQTGHLVTLIRIGRFEVLETEMAKIDAIMSSIFFWEGSNKPSVDIVTVQDQVTKGCGQKELAIGRRLLRFGLLECHIREQSGAK